MKPVKFTKMHGIGNDYIYLDCTEGCPDVELSELSRRMSERHTGVGGDGIVCITRGEETDFGMRIFNADGSEAKMCGNASRCIGKYVYDHRLTDKTELTLSTLSGVKRLSLHIDPATGRVITVTVDMGAPEFSCPRIPVVHDAPEMIEAPVETSTGSVCLTAVSMGNPHGVVFISADPMSLDLPAIGPELEYHRIWPDRANIEWVRPIDSHTVEMRVWERGSGETMACGTGACATAVAAVKTGRAQWPVTVRLRGGDLLIDMDPDTGHVLMTGPAEEVFTGVYNPC